MWRAERRGEAHVANVLGVTIEMIYVHKITNQHRHLVQQIVKRRTVKAQTELT